MKLLEKLWYPNGPYLLDGSMGYDPTPNVEFDMAAGRGGTKIPPNRPEMCHTIWRLILRFRKKFDTKPAAEEKYSQKFLKDRAGETGGPVNGGKSSTPGPKRGGKSRRSVRECRVKSKNQKVWTPSCDGGVTGIPEASKI